MNWEKSSAISEIALDYELLIIYGTNSLAENLQLTEILTLEELAYSERLKGSGQKSTWLSCRATLRMILASYLKTNPQEIDFRKGKFGKLSVIDTHLCFNVSHTNNSFLMGFNSAGRIGVDIEKLSGGEDLPSMINYAFSEDEANYCKNGEITRHFTEIWTLKEAFLKASGVGLVDELPAVSVLGTSENEIDRYYLNQETFLCPNGETGSIVYRKDKHLKFIELNY